MTIRKKSRSIQGLIASSIRFVRKTFADVEPKNDGLRDTLARNRRRFDCSVDQCFGPVTLGQMRRFGLRVPRQRKSVYLALADCRSLNHGWRIGVLGLGIRAR